MHVRSVSTFFLAGVLAASMAYAQDRRDVRLTEDIALALSTHPALTVFDDVGVRVQNGTVTLTGKVTAEYKKHDVGRAAVRLANGAGVRNDISVLPVSLFDDELRYRISRAIYSNAAFWAYSSMARPPVHVIVENGRVTLTGVVATETERVLARSLATGHGELSLTNELRTESRDSSRASARLNSTR